MTSDQPLIVRDDTSLTVHFLPQAEVLKAEALETAALICRVRNAFENERAVEAMAALETILKLAEESREQVKAPVLALGRQIDTIAKAFKEDLQAERLRLAKLCGDYQQLELARMKSEEAARLKCITDLERQRETELLAAQSHDERDAIQEKYCEIAASAPEVKAPVRAAGQVVREDWEIEVLDANTLARFHPNCVTIKPKLSEIKLMLDAGFHVNGIRAEKVIKAGVRVGKEKEALTLHGC